jgi:hypothetical protein
MKTITIIIAVLLSLQISTLFANTDFPPVYGDNEGAANYCIALDPSTPGEATFEEVVIINDFTGLDPVTPAEASFDDVIEYGQTQSEKILAPVTPKIADFNDDDLTPTDGYKTLAPTTPAEADFE